MMDYNSIGERSSPCNCQFVQLEKRLNKFRTLTGFELVTSASSGAMLLPIPKIGNS